MLRTFAKKSAEISELELKNAEVARRAAAQGIVLLKNDSALPVAKGSIALYGEGAQCTIKGGTGSGEVNARHVVSIREGLEQAGYIISNIKWLDDYKSSYEEGKRRYQNEMRKRSGFINSHSIPYITAHPFIPPAGRLIVDSDIACGTDTCFYVIVRQAGENADRSPEPGDFALSHAETANIRKCVQHYSNTIVVINVGGMVDLSPLDGMDVKGIVFFCQQGSQGGHALADIVSGKVTPSGHLAATWPMAYADIPFGGDYGSPGGNTDDEDYREGIYVGYRYFDTFGKEPRYEFGYGLSYTTFSLRSDVTLDKTTVNIHTAVSNTGLYPGKAVVQVYVSCPAGRLDKEYQRLAGFVKTETLEPDKTQAVTITFNMVSLASYDSGNSRFILEAGDYVVRVGESSKNTRPIAVVNLEGDAVLSEHDAICPVKNSFEELCALPRHDTLPDVPVLKLSPAMFRTVRHSYLPADAPHNAQVNRLLSSLSMSDKVVLCIGSGLDIALPKKKFFMVPGAAGYTTDKLEKRGIPAISLCDGPAGLRLYDVSVTRGSTVRMVNPVMALMSVLPALTRMLIFGSPKRGRVLYQYATAFPVGMSLAQTWDTGLVREVGRAVQSEMEAFGAVYWLAPGMNIQRNPLCGRNYEYFSEDPLLTGKMAAAMTRGVQAKEGYCVTIKHYCCNNQETNRMKVSSNVGERALREIYLRGFEITLRDGGAKALMTGYNRVNGVYTAESFDLCTKVLRSEWGFDGLVMTDWTTEKYMLDSAKAIRAGVNLMMPGIRSDRVQIRKALRNGTLAPDDVDRCAAKVLRGIMESETYKLYLNGCKDQ